MGTRLFCDHCGNTCHELTILSYGGVRAQLEATQQVMTIQRLAAMQNIGGAIGAPVQAVSMPAKPHIPILNVELCQHCVPIWMERVKNLCTQSDTNV